MIIQAYIGALETLTLTKAENERKGGNIPGSLPDCGLYRVLCDDQSTAFIYGKSFKLQ